MSSSTRTRIELQVRPVALSPFYEQAQGLEAYKDLEGWQTPSETLQLGTTAPNTSKLYKRRQQV